MTRYPADTARAVLRPHFVDRSRYNGGSPELARLDTDAALGSFALLEKSSYVSFPILSLSIPPDCVIEGDLST